MSQPAPIRRMELVSQSDRWERVAVIGRDALSRETERLPRLLAGAAA